MSESGTEPTNAGSKHTARRVVTYVWLAVCGVQIIIWLLMVLIGWRFLAPFWLYTVGIGGVVLGLWWYFDSSRQNGSAPERSES
jgi:4-hydroxybenzoate polyprenyltransferase